MLILKKVLNSLMTGFVSYFAATLTPYALSSAEASLCRGEAGRKKKKARGARVLLDLTWPAFCRMSWQRFVFRSPISPSSVHMTFKIGVSVESRLLVFFWGWRKANRKIKGKTLGASDTFNIQEKCFKKNISLATQSFAIVKTNSSLLRTVCFVPGERQPLHFL